MNKNQVADILNEIGVLLELKGENPFKTRAYANAARTIEGLDVSLETLVAEKKLGEIKGIGEALQQKITELVTTGRLAYYEELKASIPPGLLEMLEVPGLGPKKVQALNQKLGITSIADLEKACRDGRVATLAGFGEKTQANLIEGIERRRLYSSRHHLDDALLVAEAILDHLRDHPDVVRCGIAGSLRRNRETVGDIDFLASSKHPVDVIEYFTRFPEVLQITARGETKASVILQGGIQADFRVVSDREYPFALAYFTGSKEHNIVMRQRAIARGLRLNEYGLFRSAVETRDPALLVPCQDEAQIYHALDLAYVPPELREDTGEFAAAKKGPLPRLVEWTDLKGSLHNHSTWSDGHQTLEEIVSSMQALGLAYWAVTDHSQSAFQANGLDAGRLRRQIAEIKAINQRLDSEGCGFRLISGIEVEVHKDGSLDFEDGVLSEVDVVVGSVHQGFAGGEAEMTQRILRVVQNRFVNILGHPTGRLLLERDPYPVDMQAVIDACAETGTWIELNANPHRFDMDWRHWPYAKSKGVKCVINCDAHRFKQVGFLRLGAGIARKGWLTREDVMNTLPVDQLLAALRRKRERG